jgi:hypothetical protein
MPNRITLDDSLLSIIHKLSQGNPGAATVLARWVSEGPSIDPDACHPMFQMCRFDDADIVGPDIWILFKDVCGEDLRTMLAVLRAEQFGLLAPSALKAAIRRGRQHVMDIPMLVAKVESELPNFKRGESAQIGFARRTA